MTLQIENITGQELSPEAVQVLRRIFARYKRVVITREFGAGLSGSRVFEVRPVKSDGTPELPTVVKLATVSMIRQEWRAYQNHIHNRLPHVASATTRPTLVADTGMGGLRYPLMGSSSSEVLSLGSYVMLTDTSVTQIQTMMERLLRIMDNVWGFGSASHGVSYQQSYDAVLPPNLVLELSPAAGSDVLVITPTSVPARLPEPGVFVALRGFAVRKVNAVGRDVLLRAPAASHVREFAVRLKLPEGAPLPAYYPEQVLELVVGRVHETRMSRLRAEVAEIMPGVNPDAPEIALAPGEWFANPLLALESLLEQRRSVHTATIHGDFNLENILIEPRWGDVSLIDFAEARQDHVLHDLLHLEAEIITKLLPAVALRHRLDPLLLLAELSWRLHRTLCNTADDAQLPALEALQKPWLMLRAVRLAARRYLFDARDPGEYYQGLALYLLGALRYRNLSLLPERPLPKQMAFNAAALTYQWLLSATGDGAPSAALAPLLARSQAIWTGDGVAQHAPNVPQRLTAVEEPLPLLGALPAGSRMLLDRNPRFVGRREQLAQLGALVWDPAADPAAAAHAVAVVGLGGIGKTQLAVEFAYRFGRFFKGGVFWLSCADPAAIPAEIAACGASEAMNIRPRFATLPLEEQVRLVLAEWEKPDARLLIFDNCELPELLEHWRPRTGGSHILLTSRRADWQGISGSPVLALNVLEREESLALLREHQPDVESVVLDAIAHELGDLPLAIHLAGSYLARYRHTVDAHNYLASIRYSSPLRHQSMQGGPLLPTEHDVHVARTFAVSYDQLGRDEPSVRLARSVFHCMSCVAPGEPIPEALLRLALGGENAADVVRSSVYLGGAISQLIELGLVSAGVNRTYLVHRLVRAFTRDQLGEKIVPVRAYVERALCEEAERINARRDPLTLREWHVHLRFLADAALSRADARSADLCHALAEHLYQIADYRGACGYYEHALNIRREALGSTHPATARSLTQLGKALLYAGDPERAQLSLERALTIQHATLGDHSDTATTLNHLGFLHQIGGELQVAQQCHTEALRIRRSKLGGEHPAVVDSLSNLAFVDYLQGKLDLAHDLLQQALTLQRNVSGNAHPETARILSNLGELLLARGQRVEAEEALGEALAIQQRELGEEHPETARTLTTLGSARRQANDSARARLYYERALRIFVACHGHDHPRTVWVRGELDATFASSLAS